jgi:hypothetical protein
VFGVEDNSFGTHPRTDREHRERYGTPNPVLGGPVHRWLASYGGSREYTLTYNLNDSRLFRSQSGRAALPPLDNVTCIRNLTAAEATQYLVGHGVDPIPQEAQECKIRVARVVGCLIQL